MQLVIELGLATGLMTGLYQTIAHYHKSGKVFIGCLFLHLVTLTLVIRVKECWLSSELILFAITLLATNILIAKTVRSLEKKAAKDRLRLVDNENDKQG